MAARPRFSSSQSAFAAARALIKAVSAAGGPVALGARLGISSAAVSQWVLCPPLRVLAVESASGISRHHLRPDLYPRSEPAPRPADPDEDPSRADAHAAMAAHLAAAARFSNPQVGR